MVQCWPVPPPSPPMGGGSKGFPPPLWCGGGLWVCGIVVVYRIPAPPCGVGVVYSPGAGPGRLARAPVVTEGYRGSPPLPPTTPAQNVSTSGEPGGNLGGTWDQIGANPPYHGVSVFFVTFLFVFEFLFVF